MMSLLTSIAPLIAIILALSLSLSMARDVATGKRSRPTALLALSLFLVSGLEFVDWMTMLFPEDMDLWRSIGLLIEGTMAPVWIAFTAFFAREYEGNRLPQRQRATLAAACCLVPWSAYLAYAGAYFAPDFTSEKLLFLLPEAFYFYIALTLCCVMALFNIEATLINAVHVLRWKIKFLLLGAVSILAAMILYYSQGLLYRTIDMNLAGLRSIALLVGASMMWFSILRRGSEARISISRRLVLKSVVLIAAGVYLVGLGLLGEGVRIFGDELGRAILLTVGFIAGLALLVIFLSDVARRKIRLFLQLHFYGDKYDYRIQWEQFTRALTSARTQEELHQAALNACCDTFGITGATLFLLDFTSRQYLPVSRVYMELHEIAFDASHPLVVQLSKEHSVADVKDLQNTSPWLHNARFAIPILREDNLDGFLLLGKSTITREQYDEEDFELMNTMARHISSALLNMRLLDQLARSREMEIMGRVSTFVLHDLKNHVYTLSLMTDNARKHIANPEFQQDLVDSLESTVAKMKILISQLKGLPDRQTLKRREVSLADLIREATDTLPRERFEINCDEVTVLIDPDEMGKVVLNLCLNALEASSREKGIDVSAGLDREPFFRVRDHGGGISEEFMKNGLFEPFKSTKAKGMGIGLYQCKQIVEAHGGRIEVRSTLGQGSEFTVWLPAVS